MFLSHDLLRTFQSTLPVWGGTFRHRPTVSVDDISIHPPRVGRDEVPIKFLCYVIISIHPPRVGRDFLSTQIGIWLPKFQSTLPVWGGTNSGSTGC